ncbi:ribosome maturation factor RimM [Microvirga lenta]|uniref:ribosome maturation factor RimM n=1 Tax=Microvirga lenta TaxID=2881337 RepID=UPI00299EB59D|nr:ribosome maturation factor RimM [Microvirga lenta]
MSRGRPGRPGSNPLPVAGEGDPRVSEGRERGRVPRNSPSPGSRRSPPSPAEGRGLVLVGEFGRAHGLKGEVRLKSYTGDPLAIASYGPLTTADGRNVSLKKNARQAPGGAPDMLIVQVEGVTTREAAEALNRTELYLERDRLPPPEEDEFLLADLIGLPVQDEAGTVVGTIVDVPNYGGGDLLEIAPARRGATALLPFTKDFVPAVEIERKRVVVALPDDFFEPARPEPENEDPA